MATALRRLSNISACNMWNFCATQDVFLQQQSIHTTSRIFALRNPARFKKEREQSKEHENDWDTDLGEWTRQNQMIYPPLPAEEGIRPAEIFHGRAKIRYPEKKLFHVQSIIRNMNIDEAITKLGYMNNKASKVIKEVLLEAQEMAVKDHNVEYKSNLHIVKSFSCTHSILDFPIYRAMGRPPAKGACRFSNYYVMLREGRAPPATPKVTAIDSAMYYVQYLRQRQIIDGL